MVVLPSPNPVKLQQKLSIGQMRQIMRQGRDNRQIGERTITVFPGDDIQAAVDKLADDNGGTVLLKNGTHSPGKSITLYSNVKLMGETQAVTLDFGSAAYGVIASGSDAYTTGTLSATKGSQTVTGSSTV